MAFKDLWPLAFWTILAVPAAVGGLFFAGYGPLEIARDVMGILWRVNTRVVSGWFSRLIKLHLFLSFLA